MEWWHWVLFALAVVVIEQFIAWGKNQEDEDLVNKIAKKLKD